MGRRRWGATPFVLAAFVATRLAGRSDWPRPDAMVVAGVIVSLLAALGAARLLAGQFPRWEWVAAGSVLSAGGVWAGVPETGPAVLAGSVIAGLAVTAAVTGSRWTPAAGAGLAAVIGWAALTGATGRPWAMLGGALCAGVAPWFALRPPVASPSWRPGAGPAVLLAHSVLVVLAARWIGVDPHAGWARAAVLAAAGLAVAAATRRGA